MPEVAVLVVSCDDYSDLWNPFFENFWRNWPDCPYPVYLGANHRQYSDSKVRSILVGDDHGWGRGLRLMLDRIRSSRVILFLEDFLILQPVSSSQVEKMVQL